jgi:hypothetical protein
MWTLSMSGAMLFLLLSIWLCLHASITAQSLVVRLLTQWLRLPVPNAQEISKFALDFFDYEKNTRNLLRLPVFSGKAKEVPTEPVPGLPEPVKSECSVPAITTGDVFQGIEDLSSHQLQKTHLHLFRQLARSWRGYDAYARVCMIMGTNQLLQALGHLSVARTLMVGQQLFSSLFVVITMHSLSLIHFKLNINPTRQQHRMMTFLLAVPPLTTYIAACLWFYNFEFAADIVAIFAILIHLIWICFVLTLAIEDEGGMPKNFTTVGLSSDIVGDDTFQDYIDDELEKIKVLRKETTMETSVADESREAVVTHLGEDPIKLVKQRMVKLMKQWRNVTEGTLVLTSEEEKARKRKIVLRFDKLSQYVRGLPVGDIVPGSEEEELRVLLDVKWNRLNSGDVFINIDTGELRTPTSPISEAGISLHHSSRVKRFVDEIKRFREYDRLHPDDVEDGDVSSGTSHNTTPPQMTRVSVKSVDGTTDRTVSSLSDQDEEDDERKPLIFDDSKKTSKMLKKASNRPWSSYKQGSGLLIICWLIALIMSILLPFKISLRMPPELAASRGLVPSSRGGHSHDSSHQASHHAARVSQKLMG